MYQIDIIYVYKNFVANKYQKNYIMADSGQEPDHDKMTTSSLALLDRLITFLEEFTNKILDHSQNFGISALIHMRYQCQELQELADLLLNQGNVVVYFTEVVLLKELKTQIYKHLSIIQDLASHNVISNRTIEIPPNLQRELRTIAEIYQGIDEKLRRVRTNPLLPGQAGPQGAQASHYEETGPQGPQPPHDEETT